MLLRDLKIFSWEVIIIKVSILNQIIISRGSGCKNLVFLSLMTPPPIYSSNEEIVPLDVPICSECTYGTLSNIQFLENHSLFTYNGHNLHIEICLEELGYICKCCLQAL